MKPAMSLPAPFFDRRDNGLLRPPFVLPGSPDAATLPADDQAPDIRTTNTAY